MSDVWRALSHPLRRDVLKLLRSGALTAGDIGDHFDCTGATLSTHLKVLREAGLVSAEADGTKRVYRINLSVAEDALSGLLHILKIGEDAPSAQGAKAPESLK